MTNSVKLKIFSSHLFGFAWWCWASIAAFLPNLQRSQNISRNNKNLYNTPTLKHKRFRATAALQAQAAEEAKCKTQEHKQMPAMKPRQLLPMVAVSVAYWRVLQQALRQVMLPSKVAGNRAATAQAHKPPKHNNHTATSTK